MNSESSAVELGKHILGVFAYLDATLEPDLIEEAANYPIEDNRDWLPFRSLRETVHNQLKGTFRLQYWNCPLSEELGRFRLHHRDDMADALTVAYFLLKRGADPIDALTADYCLIPRGLLTWEDIDKVRAEAPQHDSNAMWWNFSSFYKPGDRLAEYRRPSERGYLLVRGDRLVWEVAASHMNVSWVSLKFRAELAHFESLGGTRGFLNGDFVWPDPNWVNPVSDEEDAAANPKKIRGLIASGSSEGRAGSTDGLSCSLDEVLNGHWSDGSAP
jgi:hypothetical protein